MFLLIECDVLAQVSGVRAYDLFMSVFAVTISYVTHKVKGIAVIAQGFSVYLFLLFCSPTECTTDEASIAKSRGGCKQIVDKITLFVYYTMRVMQAIATHSCAESHVLTHCSGVAKR